jgi:hypothetical protein
MSKRILGRCTLKDVDAEVGGEQKVKIGVENGNLVLVIHPEGYGVWDGDYAPVLLERHQGKLRLIVWADVNSEEPTHVIDLSGAKISAGTRS